MRFLQNILLKFQTTRDVQAPATLTELLRQRGVAPESFDPAKHFFGHVLATIKTLDSAKRYAHENYSGQWSASNPENCAAIRDYIARQLLAPGGSACDIGASRARLTSLLLKDGYDAWAIDGTDYGLRNNMLDCPKERYAVFDFRIRLDTPALKKRFDLTTNFEVLEHIPTEHLDAFIQNMAFISRKALCSAHIGGQESENHYTVRDIPWWQEKFKPWGDATVVKVPVLSERWADSALFVVDFR